MPKTILSLAEGKQRILTKIANRNGVTPYGIITPMTYHQKNQTNRSKKGKHEPQAEITALKCPYFAEDGRCTTYKYWSDCSIKHKWWRGLNLLVMTVGIILKYRSNCLTTNKRKLILK